MNTFVEPSDQVHEGYGELRFEKDYLASQLRVGYVGGLMRFNRLAERDYYEHRLTAGYTLSFPSSRSRQDGATEEEDERGVRPYTSALAFDGFIAARHDRAAFQDFDNTGAGIALSYTAMLSGRASLTALNRLESRRYAVVDELSNVTDVAELRYDADRPGTTSFGLFISGGIKHFFTSSLDTALYDYTETITQGNPGNGNGKGKGNGGGSGASTVTVKKQKKILANAAARNSYDLALGGRGKTTLGLLGLEGEALYRFLPGAGSRYLAQYANTSFLHEDVYNDFFSYSGPELSLLLRMTLPGAIGAELGSELQRRKYDGPALNLAGEQTAKTRRDLHSRIRLTLTREFTLSDDLGLELFLTGELLRNESNDQYNDFSLHSLAVGVGLSF